MRLSAVLLAFLWLTSLHSNAQNGTITGSEIGVDIAASGSTMGGDVGLGLKYGLKLGEYIIAGPSVRYEYIWWKNYASSGANQASGSLHVFGGGVFLHARFFNALFIGTEFEMLRSPYDKSGYISLNPTWAPTCFVGGGFSMEFNESIRLNAGIMYDVINAGNSPFRRSYFLQKKTADGAPAGYLPIIYRIAFFFPIS